MAHVKTPSIYAGQGVLTADLAAEGVAVTFTASGVQYDLPNVAAASADAAKVFVAIIPPDNFPRPTPISAFLHNDIGQIDPRDATRIYSTSDHYTELRLGPSLIENMVPASGTKIQLHCGGTYEVSIANACISGAVPTQGGNVYVGANGKWTNTGTNVVGICREVRSADDAMVFVLY